MVDTYSCHNRDPWEWLLVAAVVFVVGVCFPSFLEAQELSGSMRLDYQNTETSVEGERNGTLAQQYYLRLTDRLFVKNLIMFSSNMYYRTGGNGQPVDYRPRYDLQLSSSGYSGRVGYEPYTIRRGGAVSEEYRRWRGSVLLSPNKLPRLGYDMTRTRQDRGADGTGHDDWSAYNLNWQGGSRLLAASYSRQIRSPRDSASETLEVYRAMTSTDISLPEEGRLSLAYSFDRTSNERTFLQATELDQHVPSASATISPARWVNVMGQYSGRFLTRRTSGSRDVSSNDQLATGTLSITPTPRWSFGVIRYFDRAEARQDQDGRSTDYWQIRATTDRMFFRRITSQISVYRIAYTGAREGEVYSDAYFASLRGKPHRHAELSSELSVADRHGLQPVRYAVSSTSFLRLYPTRGTQTQFSYNAIAETSELSDFDISEESVTGNLQFTPDTKLSLSGSTTARRNRLLEGDWRMLWNASVTYRWPSFANLSAYYVNREASSTRVTTETGQLVESPAQRSLLLTVDWWLGPSTSLSVNYSWFDSGATDSRNVWGLGLTTQF